MRAEWTAIETALRARAPEVLKSLRPPASDAALTALAASLGCELPPALVELLRAHDGSRAPLFDNETLLSAEEIARVHKLRTDAARKLVEMGARSPASAASWWQAELVPFTDNAGDGYAVDVNGGGVYYHRHDDDLRERGDNFEQWFAMLAGQFERGEFDVKDGGVWLR